VVTDTIPLRENAQACADPPAFGRGAAGETMRRIRDEESVSSLYLD
jgi:ribose-phosphate pyrophosphokinase